MKNITKDDIDFKEIENRTVTDAQTDGAVVKSNN